MSSLLPSSAVDDGRSGQESGARSQEPGVRSQESGPGMGYGHTVRTVYGR
jgi:hypothetical protein